MRKIFFVMLSVCLLFVMAGVATAKRVIVSIPSEQVVTGNSERGNYYVVSVTVPQDVVGKRLDSVFLEFAADISRANEEDSVAVARIGVYPLTQAIGESSPRFDSTVSSSLPVAIGASRHIKLDITQTVKAWIETPNGNHGLVIGALTGPAVGLATLKTSGLGPETAVRLTYYYQDRSGERLSERVSQQ